MVAIVIVIVIVIVSDDDDGMATRLSALSRVSLFLSFEWHEVPNCTTRGV